MEALEDRVRKVVPEFERIDRYLSIISSELLFNQFFCGIRSTKKLNPFYTEEGHTERAVKQLEKLRESLSDLTSTILSKGHLTDSDAEDFIGSMNTLRVTFEVISSELSRAGSLMGKRIEEISASVSRQSRQFDALMNLIFKSCLLDVLCKQLVEKVWYAVVVSAVALLCSVYQYLLGYDLKGGTKAYSSGSLDFRDTFVSLLLFQGSYVWIFFRAVAPRNVYRRSKKDEAGRVLHYYGKFEPRFKPHRERQPAGTVPKSNYLPLGGYDSERDAEIMCQIAGYYYKRDEAEIKLRDGSIYTIPPMPEHEQSLFGEDKVRCVVARAQEVFKSVQLMNNAIILPSESNAVGVQDYFQRVVPEEVSLDALWDAADPAIGEPGAEGTPASPSDASISELDIIKQQLKEHFEAEISRRIAEQHEQHLQREKQLEERISQLERNSKLQNLEDEYVRSFLC